MQSVVHEQEEVMQAAISKLVVIVLIPVPRLVCLVEVPVVACMFSIVNECEGCVCGFIWRPVVSVIIALICFDSSV